MKLKRLADPQVSPDGTLGGLRRSPRSTSRAASATPTCGSCRVAGGEPRRLTSEPGPRLAAALEPGRPAARLPLDPRRRLAGVRCSSSRAASRSARRRSRPASTPSTWIDGSGSSLVAASSPTCGADDACNAKRARRGRQAAPRPAPTTSCSFRHWDTWDDGRRSHLFVVPLDGGAAPRPHPRRRRRAALQPGRRDDWAVSPDGQEVCFSRKDAKARGLVHERRRVRGADGGRRAAADRRRARLRRRLPLQPRRHASSPTARRCAPATRPTAGGSWSTTAKRGADADAHRGLRPRRSSRSRSRPTRRRSTSPPRRTAARPSSRCRPRAAPIATVLGGGTFGDLSVLPAGKRARGDAGGLHPPGRDRPLRRWTARAWRASRNVNDAFLARLRAAAGRERDATPAPRARACRPGS